MKSYRLCALFIISVMAAASWSVIQAQVIPSKGINQAGKNESKSDTISPGNPTASWPITLAPAFTASYSVTIQASGPDKNGRNYTLKSGPTGNFSAPDNTVWTPDTASMSATYSILNTAKTAAKATMRVDVVWEPVLEGGGGGGKRPPDIPGWATGEVDLRATQVDWHFDRTVQWADGSKSVETYVFASDGNGNGVTNWNLALAPSGASPSEPGWQFSSASQGPSAWIRKSQVKSSTPSKGKVEATLTIAPGDTRKHDVTAISPEEIAFIKIKLVKVGFEGNTTIRSDDGGTNYTAPHWNDPNGDGDPTDGHAYAVAYVSDTKLAIKPEWKLEPQVNDVKLKIKASGPGSVAIDEINAEVSGDKVDLAGAAEATEVFEKDKVRYWEEFELAFEASFQSEDEWVEVGTSKNQFYVTRSTPAVSPLFHTVVHLGCSNADGLSVPADITDSLYSEFNNRNVKRMDDTQMTYWAKDAHGVYQMGAQTTAGILASSDGNGNCEAWALLFRDMLRAQGISADRIIVAPTDMREASLLVKEWNFTGAGDSSQYFTHEFSTDLSVGAKLPAQGNNDPPPAFNAHWITKVDGEYFDPSYGTPKRTSLKQYEIHAISGFSNSLPADASGARARQNDSDPASSDELIEILANP